MLDYRAAGKVTRLMAAGSIAVAICNIDARAQDSTADQPVLGSARRASAAQGNRERVLIEPSVSLSYDSNVLRRDPGVTGGSVDNRRLTPAINASYNRQIGRTRFNLAGSLGYDFNSRFRYLNRERLRLRAGASLPVGSQCPIALALSLERSQTELADIEAAAASVQSVREFSGDIACTRPGITPNLGGSYRTVSNSGFELGNSTYAEAHGGIRFTLPSVGALTLNGQAAKITRPDFKRLTGFEDSTNIKRFYLALDRSVAARFRLAATLGYVTASPTRPTVADFSGLSYSAEARYSFTPRLRVTANGSRDIQNSTGVSASYVVRDELRVALDVDVLNRTSLVFAGSFVRRDFERDELVEGPRIGADELQSASVRINREIGRRFRLGLSAGYVTRDADVDLFDFDSTNFAVSLSSRF